MKISELQGLLTRIQSGIGDVEIVLKSAEGAAGSVIKSIEADLNPETGQAAGAVTITHGAAEPEPAQGENAASGPADSATTGETSADAPLGTETPAEL